MIGLTSLEVYNSVFNITEESNKFELYTDNFDEISFEKLENELEEILDISNLTSDELQDEIKGPRIIATYEKLETERRLTDDYIILLLDYAGFPIRGFESYIRIVVRLVEDDIQLILKQ